MLEIFTIGLILGGVGGGLVGYWLSTHIHTVADKAAAAIKDVADKVDTSGKV